MPRLCKSNSEPVDYCAACFPPTREKAFELWGDKGDGPDGRGNCFEYDCDHPPYDDTDYKCHKCGDKLEYQDDYQA